MTRTLVVCILLALLLAPTAVFGQEEEVAPGHGFIEFGVRGVTGDVDASDRHLPWGASVPFSNSFRPDVLDSTLNTYNDYRNGFYIPKSSVHLDDFLGTKSYFSWKSASNGFAFEDGQAMNRDQSFLATLGHYGLYKLQFRWDQTPHIFSGTTRTLFTSGGAGVWTVNPLLRTALFGVATTPGVTIGQMSDAITGAVAGDLVSGVPGAQLFTQESTRKRGTGVASWDITPNWNAFFLYSREDQVGTRPIGMIMGSSPASSSKFFEVEAPEQINFSTTDIKVGTEFGKKSWTAQFGYQTSLFQNNIPSMLVYNPFSSSTATLSQIQNIVGPDTSRMDLYPDNKYQQFVSAGAADIGKYVRLMASITPGVMTQDARFQPITTNTLLDLTPDPDIPNLPQASLNGRVQTLAMNYTAVVQPTKRLQFVGKYYHYDYDNQTPELMVRDVVGDTNFASTGACPLTANGYRGYCEAEQSSFHRKTFDVSGTYFLTKKNSAKVGYQREWMYRDNRNVGESIENSIYAATDLNLRKDLLLRVSGRHQSRMPQAWSEDALGFPYTRYLDESTRLRTRGDVLLQWDATQKLSLSAFWGTLQDNYNVRDAVNSLTALGDPTHSPLVVGVPGVNTDYVTTIYGPYYAHGLLNSIGRNFGFDVNYVLTKNVVLFAEYTREHNTSRILGGRPSTSPCSQDVNGFWTSSNCDPINDVITFTKDVVNTYFAGADITFSRKANVSIYYSLSAAQSNINSEGVNCQIGGHGTPVVGTAFCDQTFANWNLDSATNPAVAFGYPESVSRIHEVGAIAKFKLTQNLMPKFQYTFRMFTNVDWQTGVINPFSYVGTTIDPNGVTSFNRFLLLGADQPSYRAHIMSATLEYHF
ncbi:MAG: MtrB/PioB family outer membrane beta-barrel protein [Terriglobales bacterium]